MAFWSTQRIKHENARIIEAGGKPLVEPFDPERVGQGAYELSLSRQALVSPSPETFGDQLIRGILYPSKLDRDLDDPSKDAALNIPAGQFALVYTSETINIPKDVLAFISIKAKIKLKGLVNISGFHVDPGFSGRLKFSIYNAGNKTISLTYEKPCFLLWFCKLDAVDEKPYDHKHYHDGQAGISSDDREQMSEANQSPAALAKRLDDLQTKVSWLSAAGLVVTTILFIPMVICIFGVAFGKWLDNEKPVDKTISSVYSSTNGISTTQTQR